MLKKEGRTSRKGLVTRQMLLDSAIELISEVGYTNTTTQAVLDRSGLSRGSLLHQFHTRHELMVITGQTAIHKMLAAIEARMVDAGSLLDGFLRYPEILWDLLSEPPALALHEIQMASRWDQELFDGLKVEFSKAERLIEASIKLLAAQYSMTDVEGYIVHLNIVNDALPNLAIRRSLSSEPKRIDAERRALGDWYAQALLSRLPDEHKGEGKKSAARKKSA